MYNLLNISKLRANLKEVIEEVQKTNEPTVIIRDGEPVAAIVSYEKLKEQDMLWKESMQSLFKAGNEAFRKYLKKNNIPYPKTEEEAYEIIDKVTGRT